MKLNKTSLQKFVSLVGVAATSALLSVPALATVDSNSNVNPTGNSESSVKTGELLLAQESAEPEKAEQQCEGYQGNLTSGGGYACGLYRLRQSTDMMRRSATGTDNVPESGQTPANQSAPNTVQPPSGSSTSPSQSPDGGGTTGGGTNRMNR